MIRYLLSACDGSGLAIVAGRLALRQVLPPNVSPFGDITTDGGWSGLTANQIWVLSSILGLLFAPIFVNATSMVSGSFHAYRPLRVSWYVLRVSLTGIRYTLLIWNKGTFLDALGHRTGSHRNFVT